MDDEDDIAIIGVGCRFPGADNIDEFWRVLVNGENHVKDIPSDRWNNDAFYDENKDVPGKSYVKKAGLLNRYTPFPRYFARISVVNECKCLNNFAELIFSTDKTTLRVFF